MADAQQRAKTVEEFLQWNLSKDERYELVDGRPVPLRAMAGAKAQHDVIVVNLIVIRGNQLRGSGGKSRTADTAARIKSKNVRQPDVTIECAPAERDSLVARNPTALYEVLSPTTRKLDRSVKLEEYRRHPSPRVIVHFDPEEVDVVVYTRNATGGGDDARLELPEDVVGVGETPVALRLSKIYDGVPLTHAINS